MTASVQKFYRSLRPDALVVLWLGMWWLVNLLQAGATELAHDEAYYWLYGERLAWGYFDHPPMTALLVWLGGFFSGGELGVRLFFTLLQPLYLFLLWRIVRPADADRRDAALYCMLAAATLMLQLYGFLAVPDGPLMMTAALFLWFFKRFSENRPLSWLWMGAAMAAMAYSKYHGALVVLFAFAANPRLLLRPQLYLSGAVAALLLVPHLVWQYDHGWASFAYHLSDRNDAFRWNGVTEYVLNLLVVFNPLFVPLYVKAWRSVRPGDAVTRALKLLPPAFILFFLVSTFRGRVQPQWLIVSVFGLLYVLFAYARRHPRTRRYVMRAGAVTLGLVVLVRLEMVFNPLGLRFEIFDNRASFAGIAREAAGRPVVFSGRYAPAAGYKFYTGGEAYCQPNIWYRTHQWQFRDDDARFAGREVLVECASDAAPGKEVRTLHLKNGGQFSYFVDPEFRPVRAVEIAAEGVPERVSPGDTLHVTLRLANPYDYTLRVGSDGLSLVMPWRRDKRHLGLYATGLEFELPARGERTVRFDFVVPDDLAQGRYAVGFALRREGYAHWFNGKTLQTELCRQ